MDTQRQEGQQADGSGDESLNTGSTGSTGQQPEQHHHHKGGIHNNALFAAGMGRAATAQVDPHSNSSLANTGTNTSYEGPTAPGSGGSSGTGYTSGQADTGQSISTNSDYEQAGISAGGDDAAAGNAEDEINEQR